MGLQLVGGKLAPTTHDERLAMVCEVLGGRSADIVAAEHAIQPRTLQRWVDQFTAAGSRAMAAQEVADEDTADHLLAIVAHEIRSPLTAASIALKLLAGDKLSEERRTEIAASVAEQLDLLGTLADDVLDGASVALGRMGLSLQPVDVQRLVESSAAELDATRFRVAPGPVLTVIADPNRLRQLVGNVLRNGMRHGIGMVEVTVERRGPYALIAITNHAKQHISLEEAGTWFEPFSRVSSRTGHGLGLYVVRALTVAHAGMVGVDSLDCDECETGQNLRVWVRLPVGGPPPRVEKPAPIPSQTDRRGR